MKKFMRLLLVLAVLTSSLSFAPGAAASQAKTGWLELPDEATPTIFFPLVLTTPPMHSIFGQVTDESYQPLSGVSVMDDQGNEGVTETSGSYELRVVEGERGLAPSKDGYGFAPSLTEVNVTGDVTGQDFVATASCTEYVTNGGFENTAWWDFPSSDWPAVYSTNVVHSGWRSARTGILSAADNRYSYSSVRSPLIGLPSGATGISLRMWLYPKSTEAAESALPVQPSGIQFGLAPLAYDAQYVLVLDAADQILETVLWMRSGDNDWLYRTFDLTKWAGQSIKIQVGTYNDGAGGITSMYVDDVSLQVCGGTIPPDPGDCSNRLDNSSFEYNGDWNIPNTAYPASYSNDYAYGGSRSMRTGTPLYSGANPTSYSDAWQTTYIPSDASSAKLRIKLLPMSEEAYAASAEQTAAPEQAITPEAPEVGSVWGAAPLANDAQYILILNPSTEEIIEYLLWWQPKDSNDWLAREFDLTAYRGHSIRIQFGAYNNGYDGQTVMYVDKAVLDVCTSSLPPTCTEKIANNSFETNSTWYIPSTPFSAGYSTYLWHTGAHSMRTGIVYAAHNRYSYSDFRQTVTIPYGASSAQLKFWTYTISSGTVMEMLPPPPTAAELSKAEFGPAQFGEAAMSGDVQYLLILDYYGNWIDTLLWQRSDEQYWRQYTFNLASYAGSTISLQFGTYNNGSNGVTAMYVDDVSLQVCP